MLVSGDIERVLQTCHGLSGLAFGPFPGEAALSPETMAFRFPPVLPRGVYERQRLGQHRMRRVRLSGMEQSFCTASMAS